MRSVTRPQLEPRLEMTPLLDVIFLLLTFFIYALVLMVQARILPVKLPSLAASQRAEHVRIAGITIDKNNQLFLNRKPISLDKLRTHLAEMSAKPDPPTIYIALEADQDLDPTVAAVVTPSPITDRGPTLIALIDTLRSLKIEDFFIVGQPKNNPRR